MSFAEWIAIGAFAVSVFATAFGGLSWWAANRSANAADRSSEFAREQVAIMRVQTEVQKSQLEAARRANQIASELPPTYPIDKIVSGEFSPQSFAQTSRKIPKFTITHDSRQGYVVANAGGGTAYNVEFDHGNLIWKPRNAWPTEWESSHAEYVVIVSAWGSDPLVRVSYSMRPEGDKETVTLQVPRGG